VAIGMTQNELQRAKNIQPQHFVIGKLDRALMNKQKPCVIWFTGLSGSGKSTIANELEKSLFASGHRTYILDGDNLRHGLNKDLGFTKLDRIENIRRVAEVARLMMDAGLMVITTFISPFRSDRQAARALFEPGEFLEVFVNTPLTLCESRDPKGLYKKARAGEIRDFTGIDSPYEAPELPDFEINTSQYPDPARCAKDVQDFVMTQMMVLPTEN
jgi:bifunctional enzyme CysN/CysC